MLIRGLVGALKEPKTPRRQIKRNPSAEPKAKVHVEKMTIDMIVSNGQPITTSQAATVFKLFAKSTGILEDEREIRDQCEYFKNELIEEIQSRKDEVSLIKAPRDGEISTAKMKINEAKGRLKSAKSIDEKYRAEMELDDAMELLEHWKEELELAQVSLRELMTDKRQFLVAYVNRNFFDKHI